VVAPKPKVMAVAPSWVEAHCVVPDGFRLGQPLGLYDYQLQFFGNHYLVRGDVEWEPANPILGPAFVYARSILVAPQKALALDTPVATPSGWSTIADLRVGDEVFDEVGRPVLVTAKSPVWLSDTYRVTFSDGACLVACGDHEWWVDRRTTSSTYVETRVSTRQMVGRLVDGGGARVFRVPVAAPLVLPAIDLPVDPYVLGAWLADGSSDDGRITGLDREIYDRISLAGYEVRQMRVAKTVNVIGLKVQLRELGVLGNKHIPAPYLRASEAQRWALLQGLMDGDGYADARQGKCEFTTTRPALRDGVVELLHSLGIKHTVYEGLARMHGRVTGPKWRVNFAARADMPVFHLERKQSRLRPAGRPHEQFRHRRVVAVERIEAVPTQCITVDSPRHVFLAGQEMIPTGNCGKAPLTAAQICLEGVGPALFAGWAGKDSGWACSDWGCGCGWEYAYDRGEPMGMPWPTPLIQITASSEEQTDNIFDAVRPMIDHGPLSDVIPKTGEEFIRLPGGGRIDVVTSSARSRLGQRVTFVPQDEVGTWTAQNKMEKVADTQYRGLGGMGGRATLTTNMWDRSERSVAQREWESAATDIYRQGLFPPKSLNFERKTDRRKIFRIVYPRDTLRENGGHIDLTSIEAEAVKILKRDLPQAARFYGNIDMPGSGRAVDPKVWAGLARPKRGKPPAGTRIGLGFDGSISDDATILRGCTEDGFSFIVGKWIRPAGERGRGWRVPRLKVDQAVRDAFSTWDVGLMLCDPPKWRTEIEAWIAEFGDEVVLFFETNQDTRMGRAVDRWLTAIGEGSHTHDDDPDTNEHVENAYKRKTQARADSEDRRTLYTLIKPDDGGKIDAAVADVLCFEAAMTLPEPAGGDDEFIAITI